MGRGLRLVSALVPYLMHSACIVSAGDVLSSARTAFFVLGILMCPVLIHSSQVHGDVKNDPDVLPAGFPFLLPSL